MESTVTVAVAVYGRLQFQWDITGLLEQPNTIAILVPLQQQSGRPATTILEQLISGK
ncbi:hypothetical protein ABBQ38_000551 [Trebouxia sp. C0009 RCD-2024]